MDELKKRIEEGRNMENKKTKKSRKSKKGLTLKQRRQQEEHLRAMHKRGQAVTGEMELNIELRKQESPSLLYDPQPSPPYNTSDITKEQSNKMLANTRNFNELRELELMRRFQEEQANGSPLPPRSDSPLYLVSDSPLRTPSEYELLTAEYPPLVYGKEAEKIWNEKFVYKPNAPRRPQPSVRKTNAPRRPPPSVRRTNGPRTNAPRRPKPVTRKVQAPAPEVPVLRKMPAAPKPKQSRRRS